MPTYVYQCTACDHRFEVQQSFTDDALTTCPTCEGKVRKVFNAVGVVFKGSGFYRNDSRSTKTSAVGASSEKKDSSSESSTNSSGGSSSESKSGGTNGSAKSGSADKGSTSASGSSGNSTTSSS